ncbi:MAG: ribosome biogenesis GTPase YlqF [Eubacterium sp.]|nr:ribosome biogenesis GTPase YlqF [Eubacterium sp.]
MNQIQWYPGHMTKARRQMQEDLKLIDLIIELVDARIPEASRNPDIRQLGQGKARLIVLNKADMADDDANKAWLAYYRADGSSAMLADARNRADLNKVQGLIQEACKERIERNLRRGFKNRPIRAMVAGIPNVGKSTFINTLAGRASAKTGNQPGVTKGKQWIHLKKGLDLLDTPGILWPKFEDPEVGELLALTGSIRQNILNREELSLRLITRMQEQYPGALAAQYAVEESGNPPEILTGIARSRNCVVRGNELSTEKAADILLEEFRNGKIGRFTLELPQERG